MGDLLKLLAILGLTVFLLMRKWDLGVVLFLNSALIALLFSYSLAGWAGSILRGLVAPETISLAGAVFSVLLLAELMRRTHALEEMVTSLQVLVPDGRISVALMPLMIGLMPMLGGAMFSAPMVNEVGTPLKMSADRKTFVNYWFRHALEYIFPLYSSLLMMSALLEVSVYDFIGASWPLTTVALISGVIWGLVGIEGGDSAAPKWDDLSTREAWSRFLRSTWPLLLVILAVVILRLNMILSLIGVIVLFAVVRRVGLDQWRDVLKSSFPIHTFSAIFGVMIFKQVMQDAGAVSQIPQALSALGLPPMVIAFSVPMVVGLLTGTAAAALALSVPMVAPVLQGGELSGLAAGVWLFVGSFSGVLLSPLHLCLALTKDYFGAAWGDLYKRIVPSVGLVVAAAVVLVLLR
jgi:integral membrane protein (TIGR00529 family)